MYITRIEPGVKSEPFVRSIENASIDLRDITLRCIAGREDVIIRSDEYESYIFLAKTGKNTKDNERILVKVYKPLVKNLGLEETFKAIEQYKRDTEIIAECLSSNPNPLNQAINIDGHKFMVHWKIIPQGEPFILRDHNTVSSIGQEFIQGDNLFSFRNGNNGIVYTTDGKALQSSLNLPTHNPVIDSFVYSFSKDFVQPRTGKQLLSSKENIKPRFDFANNILVLYVTDLAAGIETAYKAPSTVQRPFVFKIEN